MEEETSVFSVRVYDGRILNLRLDTVRLTNGQLTRREIVEHGEAVAIVPVHSNGDVLLVRQFRKPVELHLLEIPAGGMEPGESPSEAASRELQEETGCCARRLDHMATFYTTPGFCTEKMHLFLAAELESGRLDPDDDEDIQCVRLPLQEALRTAASDPNADAKTLLGLLLAAKRLGGSGWSGEGEG